LFSKLSGVYVTITIHACVLICTNPVSGQNISYLLPDIGAPGMNTYVELIAPHDAVGNFGTDGVYPNNFSDPIRLECVNPDDTNRVKVGPLVVSWNGRLVSTQIFVLPDVSPNSTDWQQLLPEFIIPLQFVRNGVLSNIERFFIVRPHAALTGAPGLVFGTGGAGVRSRRGAMIVDSMDLGNGIYGVSVADCDPVTPGNQGYLPFVLLSRGPVRGQPGAEIRVSAAVKDGGPGGGGGGGNFCDWSGSGSDGGAGFTGGGPGGRNRSGNPFSTDEFRDPGVSTGPVVGNTGTSINGIAGGSSPWYEASGGGTGHPFGSSGTGCASGSGCNSPGGFGGGSGQRQQQGGGGGGYATAGESSQLNNGGQVHGNRQIIPLAGGSGGASGNPQGFTICSGEGGGGGGAIRLSAPIISDLVIRSDGGDGQARSNGPGGAGSGGGISIATRLYYDAGQLIAEGGGSTQDGGAGRLRIDGPRYTIILHPQTVSTFRGPSTDTSQYVSRSFLLTGTGNGDTLDIYLKSDGTPWYLYGTIGGYTKNAWTRSVTLPGNKNYYYLVVLQRTPNPLSGQFTAEPVAVMSQMAANLLIFRALPRITAANVLNLPAIVCRQDTSDTLVVRNIGDGPLLLSNPSFIPGTGVFTVTSPSSYPVTVPAGDSLVMVIRFSPSPGQSGVIRDTLVVPNNDTATARNPWRVALQGIKDSAGFVLQYPDIDFGSVLLCERSFIDTVFSLRNSGTIPLSIPLPTLSVPELSLVSPPTSSYPVTVDPGNSIPVRVRFTPAVPGSVLAGTITFRTDAAACNRIQIVSFTGRGDTVSYSALNNLTFAATSCPGDSTEENLVINNTGTVPITLDLSTITNGAFRLLSPAPPVTIAAGAQTIFRIGFTAPGAGTHGGTMNLAVQPCSGTLVVSLSGRSDSIQLVVADLDFGVVEPRNFPSEMDLVIANTGNVALDLQQTVFATGTPFSVISGIPVSIPPGGNATIRIRFNDPGSDAQYSDVLNFVYVPRCAPTSINIRGIRATAAATIEIGTVSAAPGEIIEIPVYLRGGTNPTLFGATGISTTLRYDKTLLEPRFSPGGSISGQDRQIPLTLPLIPDQNDVIALLPFTVMLGNMEQTVLLLEGSLGIGGSLDITEIPGRFTLANVCREGGTRLFDDQHLSQLRQNRPNPFNPVTTIEYTAIEKGIHQLSVFDGFVRNIADPVDSFHSPGTYSVQFHAGDLPSGIYYYVLRTPSRVLTRAMAITK